PHSRCRQRKRGEYRHRPRAQRLTDTNNRRITDRYTTSWGLTNRNVAHSENSMTVTTPMIDLQRSQERDGEVSVVGAWSITRESSMPSIFVEEFRGLLERLVDQLTVVLRPMKLAVMAEIGPEQAAELHRSPRLFQFTAVEVSEWTPDDRRPGFPASRFAPIHTPAGGTATVAITIEK
ncbi:hypothetical protein KEC56_13625, partial [Microbacterium sp. YMB-B2]